MEYKGNFNIPEKEIYNLEILDKISTEESLDKHSKIDRREKILKNVSLDHLEEITQRKVKNFIFENEDILWLEGEKLGLCAVEEHQINLTDSIPVYKKQFPLPYKQREEAELKALKLIHGNLVRLSTSPYNAPVFVVDKKVINNVKRVRLVVDFRCSNSKTIPDPYMLPVISEIFDEIGKNKYFLAIDISQGFHNVKIKSEDMYRTAWTLPRLGRFEYKVLPFGLSNSPRTFQRILNKVLEGLICFCYIDDIIIFSKTKEENLERLKFVVDRLRKANLKLQTAKCKFLVETIKFLGHILSENGLEMEEEKVKAIKKFPIPETIRKVQSFLAVCNYYRKFIPHFSRIPAPLTQLLHKDKKITWGKEQQRSFDEMKSALCKAPILEFSNMSRPFSIIVDASILGVGGYLAQSIDGVEKPIAYFYRVLRDAEKRYSTYKREALDIKVGSLTMKKYVYGTKFSIFTDHRPLLSFRKADKNARVQRWRTELAEYDFEIFCRPGKINILADALSRNPITPVSINVTTRAQKRNEVQEKTTINGDKNSKKVEKSMTAPKEIPSKNQDACGVHVIYSKNSIILQKNSIVTFINTKREFLDPETAKLFTERKITIKDQVEKDQVELYKIGKKKYFIMCIDTHCSQSLILKSIKKCFKILKN